MPKTFPIMIEVEEIALGPVLRKLNEMAGIAKLHLDLGKGGEQGQEKIAAKAVEFRERDLGKRRKAITLASLTDGPKHVSALRTATGCSKTSIYGLLHHMRVEGLTQASKGTGMHELTAKGVAAAKAAQAQAAKATAAAATALSKAKALTNGTGTNAHG
jgi:hypothetical protein